MLSEFLYLQQKEQKNTNNNEKILLNYGVIKIIDKLDDYFKNVRELILNHNLIEKLDGIQQFKQLKTFHLKFNYVSDIDQIFLISNKNNIISLNFIGNPIEFNEKSNYQFFAKYFPNLKDFNSSNDQSFIEITTKTELNENKFQNKENDKFINDFERIIGIPKNRKENLLKDINNLPNISAFIDKTPEQSINKHISIIDDDICKLADIFHEKMLKEKTIRGFKKIFLENYYNETKFSEEFYKKMLINKFYFSWKIGFYSLILKKNINNQLKKNRSKIEKDILEFKEEITTNSFFSKREKKNNNIPSNQDLDMIIETEQDYIDTNRYELKKYSKEREKNNDDMPLSSNYSSKCPYGSI